MQTMTVAELNEGQKETIGSDSDHAKIQEQNESHEENIDNEESKDLEKVRKEDGTKFVKKNGNQYEGNATEKEGQQKTEFAMPQLPCLDNQNDKQIVSDSEKVKTCITPKETLSSAEKAEKTPSALSDFPYKEPTWGGVPTKKYSVTVLKDGVVKDTIILEGKSFFTFGRLDDCDVTTEHPSCSRYHAVLQYCVTEKDIRKEGYYLYDMGSTHGTCLNKEKIKAKVYSRVRVGYQMKFGGSSRIYIMEGPPEDQEEELDLDVMREKRRQYLQQKEESKQKLKAKSGKDDVNGKNTSQDEANEDDREVTWGFGEDAVEEHINLQELFEKKKSIEVRDPKKTLRNFFEKEGLEFEYEMSTRGSNHVAKVRLPIETAESDELVAEGTSSNKKDAVMACAVEACKLIQAYDMMQNKCKENQNVARRRELEANDFYDSDEDTFLDRTGAVEKKRRKRKEWAGKKEKDEGKTETHDTLIRELKGKEFSLKQIEERLNRAKAAEGQDENEDSLDDYMASMEHLLDKATKSKLKRELVAIRKEIEILKKLIEKTKPALPTLQFSSNKKETQSLKDKKPAVVERESAVKKDEPSKEAEEAEDQMRAPRKEQKNYNLLMKRTIPQDEGRESTVKKKRHYGAASAPKRVTSDNLNNDTVKNTDEEMTDWMPPTGQTGDGRTHLNDKFGY